MIRHLTTIDDFKQCIRIQREAWGFQDIDMVPIPLFVLARDGGGIVIGKEIDGKIVGFAYSFPLYKGEWVQHSHMLAVLPEYQGRGIGYELKMKQREIAIEMGYRKIQWTFDVLQAKNAYFNLHKLGVIVREYLPNYYGEISSTLYSGLPTDRLLAEWFIKEERKKKEVLARVEIPADIQKLKSENIKEAERWQERIRKELTELFSRGYYIFDVERKEGRVFYLLTHD